MKSNKLEIGQKIEYFDEFDAGTKIGIISVILSSQVLLENERFVFFKNINKIIKKETPNECSESE